MEVKKCPKCGSNNLKLFSNAWETVKNGLGIRVECIDCNFKPPQSKWTFYSDKDAIETWNKYKRK